MKTPARDISIADLTALLQHHYALAVDRLTFLPEGEDAFSYIAWAGAHAIAFVRLQHTQRAGLLEQAYQATYRLHHEAQLDYVIAPISSTKGALTLDYGSYSLAVFPYVAGHSAYPQGLTPEALKLTAKHIAQLHRYADGQLKLDQERFDNPFEEPIEAVFAYLASSPHCNPLQSLARDLLVAQRADIEACCERMRHWQAQFLDDAIGYLPSHGDPNLANIMVGKGRVYLIDWGEIKRAPCERDLIFFNGPSFASFMKAYWHWHQPQLDLERFSFYAYRWPLQEIADYATRLFFEDSSQEEAQHAYRELLDYLPLRHEQIKAELQHIQHVLEALLP